ncbi:dolichol-phosphate mannosyltransferase [Rhodovulum iodosum]|uniref:Dolichol-phosphate mannosyltransferase n=1 Tax=Rhodovulum iodosum TaxID=68291 RepID=A0ABV3XRV3_9RHOB|nr:glycosyltransferase family 2 protein [Rhodovulum robiginosum]RSK30404.1 glycosyltransferase family 2 protein [Rhodovulum robiginosum]
MPSVSIVIPMKNEAGNVAAVVGEIATACAGVAGGFEIIVVDDGSTDATAETVRGLMAAHPGLRLISHDRSGGQSAAVHSGVTAAAGTVICTLDGDGQNPPSELPKLFTPLLDDATGRLGLVAGQRVGRQDTLSKRYASRFANAVRAWMLKDGTRDTGCGLKGFRRDAFLTLPYFDHMHRYLPALFKRDGWEVALVDVSHRERGAGRSNYNNLQRALVGIHDLFGVAWLIRRRKKARPLPEATPDD